MKNNIMLLAAASVTLLSGEYSEGMRRLTSDNQMRRLTSNDQATAAVNEAKSTVEVTRMNVLDALTKLNQGVGSKTAECLQAINDIIQQYTTNVTQIGSEYSHTFDLAITNYLNSLRALNRATGGEAENLLNDANRIINDMNDVLGTAFRCVESAREAINVFISKAQTDVSNGLSEITGEAKAAVMDKCNEHQQELNRIGEATRQRSIGVRNRATGNSSTRTDTTARSFLGSSTSGTSSNNRTSGTPSNSRGSTTSSNRPSSSRASVRRTGTSGSSARQANPPRQNKRRNGLFS